MKIYLAGPMRGYPDLNFPAFHSYAKILRDQGHEVFSPAELTGDQSNLREVLGADLGYICDFAEGIAMMPGWERSDGATAEWATARALGLKMIYLI